jgi:hypothetical protein
MLESREDITIAMTSVRLLALIVISFPLLGTEPTPSAVRLDPNSP